MRRHGEFVSASCPNGCQEGASIHGQCGLALSPTEKRRSKKAKIMLTMAVKCRSFSTSREVIFREERRGLSESRYAQCYKCNLKLCGAKNTVNTSSLHFSNLKIFRFFFFPSLHFFFFSFTTTISPQSSYISVVITGRFST